MKPMLIGNIELDQPYFDFTKLLPSEELSEITNNNLVKILYKENNGFPTELMNNYYDKLFLTYKDLIFNISSRTNPYMILIFKNVKEHEDTAFSEEDGRKIFFTTLMLQGSGQLITHDSEGYNSLAMKKGDVVILDPLTTHKFQSSNDGFNFMLHVCIHLNVNIEKHLLGYRYDNYIEKTYDKPSLTYKDYPIK